MTTHRERLRAARRLHDPSHQEPPVGIREIVLAAFLIALGITAILAPGLLAEIGSIPTLDWQEGSALLMLVAVLNGWALLGVRAMSTSTRIMHVVISLICAYQISDLSMTHLGLSLSRFAFIVLCGLLVARTITRPNDAERIAALERQVRAELES